ncbi:cupin domain-containing protein [Firmicutes bacterium AM55-24TS]|jgi:mannose-6-phosphate isomerase-like protein (cupin superfamily)|nr:cupin domain-containing protein [Firmicutes bacterium AM55-24TS]
MDSLKNVPTEPTLLTELINAKKNQVVSMALSKRDDVTVSVFSFSDNEGVSEEEYFGDTLYYVLEGKMSISINEKTYELKQGECMAVEAKTSHAIGSKTAFKVMQITL